MYKLIILLKLLTADTHTDVLLTDGSKLTLSKENPEYEYCAESLAFALEDNELVGVLLSKKGDIQYVLSSVAGVASEFYMDEADKLKVGMLPMAGIYSFSKAHPYYERFRLVLVESQQTKKKVRIFIRPGTTTDIVDVRLEK